MKKDSDLTVVTRAKELSLYVLAVTDRSPKKYRFTLVSRMQGYVLDIVESLYLANCVVINKEAAPEDIKE